MKRFVAVLTLVLAVVTSVVPASAGDGYWNYTPAYNAPIRVSYPAAQPAQRDYPILKKVLIGGALIGIGFAAGRLTAPRPDYHHHGYGNRHYYSGHRHGHHRPW